RHCKSGIHLERAIRPLPGIQLAIDPMLLHLLPVLLWDFDPALGAAPDAEQSELRIRIVPGNHRYRIGLIGLRAGALLRIEPRRPRGRIDARALRGTR